MAQLDEGRAGVTFLDNLQSHKGGLIQLKTQLFWYDGRDWDNNPGRICLLLDADSADSAATSAARTTAAAAGDRPLHVRRVAVALLLIEGQPQWVCVAEKDVEVISGR